LGFNLLAAPSHPKISDFRFSILDSIQNPQSKIPNPKSKILLSSGLRAAFVALTVAGQQGNSRASPFPPILDFGLPILDWVLNLKSKI
jgi:hypothetical protein